MPTDLRKARERIADLEHFVGEHLSATGACGESDDDGEESLCTSPECTYCELARALQPTECGLPLQPRPSTCGCGHPLSDHYLGPDCAQEPCRECDCDTYGEA